MNTHNTSIRYAKPGDVFALSDVYAETQRATYRGIIPHDALEFAIARRKPDWWHRNLGSGSSTFILEFEERPEGYVTFGPSRYGDIDYEGEIYEIYIRPTFQGLGFGRVLFDHARAELQNRGNSGLMLWTIASNEKADGFFRHLGATPFAQSQILYRTKTLARTALGWPKEN